MTMLIPLLCLTAPVHAVPAQFTHQGRLLDADGVPLGGEVSLSFRVMDSESDGTILWEDTIVVALDRGYYSAVLGVDEDTNPLDTAVLSQAPVWLELQLDGEPAMAPRSPIHAVPYATMATVAEEVSGGPVDASVIAVGGTTVINDAGEWVGAPATVSWGDLDGVPAGFADGIDDDTNTDALADLAESCADGGVPVWDAVVGTWACGMDSDTLATLGCTDGQLIRWSSESTAFVCADDLDAILTEAEVDAMVADNGYALASDAFSRSFLDLTDVPSDLMDGDADTQLTEPEVDAMVEDNGYALLSELFSGSFLDLTDVPAWSFLDLTDVPSDLMDGDDNTQLTEPEVDAMVADNGYALLTELFSGSFLDLTDVPAWSFLDLTDVPSDLMDGDDVLTEAEVVDMVAANGFLTEADVAVGGGGGGTVIYTRCAWTGEIMPTIGSCTPPECPASYEDLGITGNVKTGLAAHASTDYSPPYSESSGYQERGCYIANPVAVLTTRCSWTGAIAPDIETCTPPECPDEWTDLGVTGNIKTAVGMYGSTDYSPSFSESSGYQERTCTR
ncbi:MAG: hypothetical protein VX127_11535 [Myxococcota bacterium]|nr:hypothetical protein [Myxococcota bacterium]